jgi:hypothetical protein
MRTVEIAREAWTTTLDEFSTAHQGWLVSLDVLDVTIGAQSEVDDLPLLGVSVGGPHESAVTIAAGRSWTEHVTHTIHSPTRVQLERRDDGADVALQIESADGAKAILRFRTAARPETVDGMPRH